VEESFEDRARTLAELESFFIFTLSTWTTTFVAPLVLSFQNFHVFSYSS
jgi:hypothetical protein